MNIPTRHNTIAARVPTVRLTPREMDVLNRVATGASSREIADALFLSKRTIDFHLANVYAKLSVDNRLKAYRAACRMGLIPFDPTRG